MDLQNNSHNVKVIMTWDILPGREQDYFEFVVREFVPGMQRIGIQPTEAWFTQYGDQPQILTGGIAENFADMRSALESEDWQELRDQLSVFVTNFSMKVVKASVSAPLMQPTRCSREASRLPLVAFARMRISRTSHLLGLAPGEGCLATGIAAGPGGLLHRRFTLTSRDR